MEKETMKRVLEQCPGEYAKGNYQTDLGKCKSLPRGDWKNVADNWKPDRWDSPPNSASQELLKVSQRMDINQKQRGWWYTLQEDEYIKKKKELLPPKNHSGKNEDPLHIQ